MCHRPGGARSGRPVVVEDTVNYDRVTVKSRAPYCNDPADSAEFTRKFDAFYTRLGPLYSLAVNAFPFWRRWLRAVLPHIRGPRVLEVSFGTGYLLARCARKFDTYGLEYNERFVRIARRKLAERGLPAAISQGTVETLPYEDAFFDSIVNTMAFTGYPNGAKAMGEMRRVLKPGGRLLMVDVAYPVDHQGLGMQMTRAWMMLGDIVRDMPTLFGRFGFEYSDVEIGGFGSVHLFVAYKC